VSTPLAWEEVEDCQRAGDAGRLVFSPDQVLQRIGEYGDLFAPVLHERQELPSL
jgi:bifunctional non-homologous end joining protein LigD